MSKQSRVFSQHVMYVRFNATLQVPLGVQLLNENKTDEMGLHDDEKSP